MPTAPAASVATSAHRPPGWALASAVVAPVAVVAAWTWAAAVQPPGYDAVHETISALARHGAAHREIMTTGLALLGIAHVVTALGLRPLATASRAVLATAGLANIAVAVFAQPPHGSSGAHIASATVGFVLLALWPASTVAGRRRGPRPAALRTATGWTVAAVSSALLVWFVLTPASGPYGLAERVLVGQQALWPLVVVLSLRRRTGRAILDP